ncbi:uncharacterized protein IL334_007120 [Kwoniella shivajii]|uniref:Uncharacterized protein n=1 Tax=Kwoniella shivajii TaxID=564305 RepID=A0ABZ1D8K3_9TREE|nr:hypothetical protein IL334_007120 [Kwoniella shivajii]
MDHPSTPTGGSSTYQDPAELSSNPSSSQAHYNDISLSRSTNLNLPPINQRNSSVSSLMDAVMGPPSQSQIQTQSPSTPQTQTYGHGQAPFLPTPIALKPHNNPLTGNSRREPMGHGYGTGTGISSANNGAGGGLVGDSDWDILSDVTTRINEGAAGHGKGKGENDEAVKELQEKVDKRRSQLPHLESQLAALEAQIKATEERLNRAAGVSAPTGTSST